MAPQRRPSYLSLMGSLLMPDKPAAGQKGEVVAAATEAAAPAAAPAVSDASPAPTDAAVTVIVAAPPRRRQSTTLRRRRFSLDHLHPASPFWELAPRPDHHPLTAMPPALRFNPFIAHGFRPPGAHPWACVCSWASLHNESLNVWTHLAPLLAGAAALAAGAVAPWPAAPGAWLLSTLPAAACLAGSVTYHTLMPSHDRYALWLALDLAGVFTLFVAGMAPLLWWGFACWPGVRAAFLALYYGGAAGAVVASLRGTTPAARAAPMAGLAGVRALTLATRAALGAGAPAALPHYLAMEALSIAGALLNVARWPEKWLHGPRLARATARAADSGEAGTAAEAGQPPPLAPHLVDFALNSHNLMHLAVLAALVSYGRGAAAEYEFYHHGPGRACAA